ncbi:Protein CBG07231 [Caenorhabditis briggsae]|uniref:NTF2-like domain-containing protein n=2 Tax=Caenorhabditis briggsae TaxID=6238 RepID=A0AAE8ZVG4_CAEBR|nr:Protein CBG07231 [Caenorhabditis briggsae]ULT85084.1 hypothetical protein L3Y34_013644 [Caenorhabditis briggsae]CAP27767.1 Protein CBG07231 [Caenorhabditis briggsae]
MSPSLLVLCLLAGTSWSFVPDDPDFRRIPSIGYRIDGFYLTRNAFAPSSDTAQQIVEKFLARMTRSLESKDVAVIAGLFQPGFVFKGCRITGDKILDTGSSIEFTVHVSGFLSASTEVKFLLNKLDQQLETGDVTNCSRGFLGFSQPEDSNAIIHRFLNHVKQVFASRSPVLIGNLLDDGFAFKTCGPHPKSEVVEQIISFLSSGALIEFPLIESKWIDQGQIEYLAEVNVSMMDRFQARFVYSPQRNVIMSGGFDGCPLKRFRVFY